MSNKLSIEETRKILGQDFAVDAGIPFETREMLTELENYSCFLLSQDEIKESQRIDELIAKVRGDKA